MLKKYLQTVQKINSFNFSGSDDSHLLARIKIKNNQSNKAIPEIIAIIREVIDRRLGIWNLFNADLPAHLATKTIQKAYNEVKEKRPFIDSSQIYLNASFYMEVRELRLPKDDLTFMPFDVQLLGALALLDGKIAEMGTGEGKTVVAVFPACIRALSGKKVHIATVNDYLALRDCTWMNPVYAFLGLKADCILGYMQDSERQNSYKADLVYGSNYEFGFDYLKDNLKNRLMDRVQSDLDYVIIDEIDSILMDEAGTPLIISGAPINSQSDYWKFKNVIESLIKRQNEIIEKLFRDYETESDQLVKIIRLIQILMADPWNADLLNYLSENNEIIKKMRTIRMKYVSARSEHKLEQDILYAIDEKNRTIKLTDMGISYVEESLGKGFLTLTDQRMQENPPLSPFQKGETWVSPFQKGETWVSPFQKGETWVSPFQKGEVIFPIEKGGRGDFNSFSEVKNYEQTENIRNFLQLLKAYILYRKDEDYVVHNGKIIIVDEYTGRFSFGKKYEEGLHQALECKEGLAITPENRVMGKITHSNYFRLYKKMSGMTATAHTEADEFKKLYKLNVVRIPTNKPAIRVDLPDFFFKTEEAKIEAIVSDIKECHAIGKPVLIGTKSVEKSERLSKILAQNNIPHNVLNAKNHSEEAEIIKNAGQPYAVTIATNMAGRGTDIKIPSNDDTPPAPSQEGRMKDVENGVENGVDNYVDKLGLNVIGTERHLARRIDQQLAGRSGRQGDPGSSRFYLSLQDDLFRMFADDEMSDMIKAIEKNQDKKLANLTRKAQQKSEETSYNNRRHLIERDDVTDNQRKRIYKMRLDGLSEDNIDAKIQLLISDYADSLIIAVCNPDVNIAEKWNEMKDQCAKDFGVNIPDIDLGDLNAESAKVLIINAFQKTLDIRESKLDLDFAQKMKKAIMIEILDDAWTDFLSFQHEIDTSMVLRSHVKGDIITDYRLESSKMFRDMLVSVRYETLKGIFTYPISSEKIIIKQRKDFIISDQIQDLLSGIKDQ
jgi:preprotein translocase subunit SecA